MDEINKINATWDFLIDNELLSEEALRIIIRINGYNIETVNDVLYFLTGYRDLDQLKEYED